MKTLIEKLSARASGQVGEDPVSIKYREIFTEETILSDPICWKNLEEFQKEKKERYAAKIPPGYKDTNKENGNDGGDLIIWKSILEEAKKQDKDCIFVTNDAKEDWFHLYKGASQLRSELLEEFRRGTNGKTLHIIHLEKFLELFDASEGVIEEAKESQEEPSSLTQWDLRWQVREEDLREPNREVELERVSSWEWEKEQKFRRQILFLEQEIATLRSQIFTVPVWHQMTNARTIPERRSLEKQLNRLIVEKRELEFELRALRKICGLKSVMRL